MRKKNTYLMFLAAFAAFAMCLCSSCSKDDDEEFETKPYIPGSLSFLMPDYVDTMSTYTLEAKGLTEPQDARIQYFWTTSSYKIFKDTLWGQTIEVTMPDTLGVFVITAHAKAEGYYNSTYSHDINLLKGDQSFTGYEQPQTTMTDSRDDKIYAYTEIGHLFWFARNLDWEGAGHPYAESPSMGKITGRYYTWEDATGGESASGLGKGPQGVCPEGWSVPTNEDWEDFSEALYGERQKFHTNWKGGADKLQINAALNGTNFWPYDPACNPENKFGWAALAAGYAQDRYLHYRGMQSQAMWWSSTLDEAQDAVFRHMEIRKTDFFFGTCATNTMALSVRCVQLKKN